MSERSGKLHPQVANSVGRSEEADEKEAGVGIILPQKQGCFFSSQHLAHHNKRELTEMMQQDLRNDVIPP